MGVVINARDFTSLQYNCITRPVIYCCSNRTLEEQAVSVNIEMAKKLSCIQVNRRTIRLERCFQQVLKNLPDDVVIKDFDVMFNPDYAVDILWIMCSTAKMKSFQVLWPGKYDNGRLVYAEEGFRDYKVFEISKYDITCIV